MSQLKNSSSTSPQVIIILKNGENFRVTERDFQAENLVWLKRGGDVFHQFLVQRSQISVFF